MDLLLQMDRILVSLSSAFATLVCNISYNIIYYFSVGQIKIRKLKRQIVTLLNTYSSQTAKPCYNDDIEFILDGKVIHRSSKEMLAEIYDETMKYPEHYDFIIYTERDPDNDETSANKKIIRDHTKINCDLVCEKSNMKFLLCEFEIGEKKIKIDFKNEFSNYYINGNTFDIKFFIYFLQKYYSEHLDDADLEKIHNFRINVLDHNVSNELITKDDLVKINNSDYEKMKIS